MGCASIDATAPAEPSAAVDATSTTGAGDAPEAAVFTVDDHIGWLIGVLDAGEFDHAEATERFDTSFLAQVPVATLNAHSDTRRRPGRVRSRNSPRDL